jgi:hypothetical protein
VNILQSPGQPKPQPFNPYVQIREYKIVQKTTTKADCFKGTVSDGHVKYSKTFFAQESATKLKDLPEGSRPIVQILKHIAQKNDDKGTYNFIIMDIAIIYPDCEEIGEPMEYQDIIIL